MVPYMDSCYCYDTYLIPHRVFSFFPLTQHNLNEYAYNARAYNQQIIAHIKFSKLNREPPIFSGNMKLSKNALWRQPVSPMHRFPVHLGCAFIHQHLWALPFPSHSPRPWPSRAFSGKPWSCSMGCTKADHQRPLSDHCLWDPVSECRRLCRHVPATC